MSKSYGNTIDIFAEGKSLEKAVMGVVTSGLAYWLNLRVLSEISPVAAMSSAFMIPLFGVAWGSLFLDEALGPGMLLGGAYSDYVTSLLALKHLMGAANTGIIINTTWHTDEPPAWLPYEVSKAAKNRLLYALGHHLRGKNIPVIGVAPELAERYPLGAIRRERLLISPRTPPESDQGPRRWAVWLANDRTQLDGVEGRVRWLALRRDLGQETRR